MSDLRKLIDEENDELLVRILRSAEDDSPSNEGRDRTFAALGLGAAPIAGVFAGKGALFGMSAWKWVVSLVVVTTIGSAGIVVSQSVITPRSPPPPVDQPIAKAAPKPARPSANTNAPAPTAETSAAAEIASAVVEDEPIPTKIAKTSASTSAHAPAASSSARAGLGAELAALDEARTALASGNAPAALARLDRYTREFPHAVLGPEATMLRIEALHKAGDDNAARSLGKRFLGTPYEDRVRTLLGSSFDAP